MGGKSQQYFLGMGMSSRNGLREGTVAQTRAANCILLILPLPSYPSWFCTWPTHLHIQQKFGAWPPASHPLSVLEWVSFRGKFPCPGETGTRSSFPGFVPLFIVILPSGRPEQFPSPPLHVHPSNGFRIWHWKIKFKKKHQIPKALKTFKYIAQLFPPCTIVLGGLARDQTSFLLPILTIPLGIEE